MPANDLSSPASANQQEETDTLTARLPASEKERIAKSLDRFGWTQSAGVRTVMNAFADSQDVQDAVIAHLRAA